MITRDGHAKILDFGLAKLLEQGRPSDLSDQEISAAATVAMSPRSKPGLVIGTVGYMSPEQAQGKTKEIDHRSDIFSFGCILYEAVTGHKTFAGRDAIDTLNKIIREPATPISDLRPDTPNHLQRIVRRCLAKDPDDRYQTIKDVAIELRELRRELAGSAGIDLTVAPSTGSGPDREVLNSHAASGASRVSSAEYIVSGIKQHKLAAAITVMALVFGAIGLGIYLHTRSTEVAIESIAVLPFQNRSNETDTEYLSDGLAESLIYRLSQLPNLKVSPTSSVFHYKGQEIDPIKVGKELGVNAVLSGRIVQRGENLTISAELVDVRYNKLLWGEQYERKMSELLQTQREIAREIVDKLKLKVSGEENGLAKHYTESNEAYQLYLKGRFYYNKRSEEGMQKALDKFQQAIEKDPNFALAYSGVADTYDLLGTPDAGGTMPPNEALPKARAAAMKALEIDESLAEPHVSLAHVKYYYDRDWPAAEREFKRAIELNPNYPQAHHWYGIYLMWSGRTTEALAEIKRAQELDPLSLPINMTVGWLLCEANRTDEGIEQLRKTLEMEPAFVIAHHRLALCYERKGAYDGAITEYHKIIDLGAKPLGTAGLAEAYAMAGNRSEAQKELVELQELSKQRNVSPSLLALIYAALGDKDQAFAWLDKSVDEHDLITARLKVDQRFDSLRSDRRFNDLVRRIGIP
jgi:TolB-like protein/Flp pilus assembly protein TadD